MFNPEIVALTTGFNPSKLKADIKFSELKPQVVLQAAVESFVNW